MGYAGSGDRVIRAACESHVNILEILKGGPKTYRELRGQTDATLFDIQLDKMLKSKAVVRVYDFTGETAMFGLPQAPKQDEPLPPSRTILSLSKPRKNQYCFDKGGRKKCPACKRRRGRSAYLYGGKAWGKCYDCRETP